MAKTTEVTYCKFDAAAPGPYTQYLLPHIVSRARWNPERFIALGAAWRGYAVGAAVVSMKEAHSDEAVLDSLFVDPNARGQGIGTGLLRLAAEEARKRGAERLELSYIMPGPELEAMDKIVRNLGGEPVFRSNVYTMETAKFHDSPVFGWTVTPDFHPAANIKTFRDLTREQMEQLNENEEIPAFLRPAARKDLMDPALSVAWLEDGEVVCFQLIGHSGPRSYTGLSSWRSDRAPGDAYVHLISAVANLCYYDAGGDFLFYGSPVNDYSEALTRAYLGDLCTCMEEHEAELRLPVDMEEAGDGENAGEGEL